MTKLVKIVYGAKPNGSEETMTVSLQRLRLILVIASLLIPLSSVITFVTTGNAKVERLTQDLSFSVAKFERKTSEHDAVIALIQQELSQIRSTTDKLLDIQLANQGRRR